MPLPNTKVTLNAAIAAGGGYTLRPNANGDLTSTLAPGLAGGWVSTVGDLNGDGIAEVVIGAAGDDDKAAEAGRIFVAMSGVAAGSSVSVADPLSALIIDGVNAGDMAGFSVSGLADMNGDGRAELLIGAPGMAKAGAADAGAAFVVWGTDPGGAVDLGDPFAGDGKGYAIKGEAAGDMAGYAVLSVGDMNGDGLADALVGAPGQDAGGLDSGAAYVVWGKTSNGAVQLTSVAGGTGGFKITGAGGGDAIGTHMGVLGDTDGDGRSELLIGSPDYNDVRSNQGAVYVVRGKATGTAVDLSDIEAGIGGYIITGAANDDAGAAVGSVGDVNGDGLHDMLIGAPRSDRAYVVFGKADNAAVDLADVRTGVGGFQILAQAPGDLEGLVVTGGADLNRDGVNDLVIGAQLNEEGGADAGAVYVVWGGAGSGTVNLSLVAQGIGGAKIVGAAGSLTGTSVAIGGDMNGDGTADLVIGAPGTGAGVKILYTPASWQPDRNIYGTTGDDLIGPGFGGATPVGEGNDTILGLAGNDTILAAGGDDSLEGGAGADSMSGGAGNDTYLVDSSGDIVVELAGEGSDTVVASVDWVLGDEVEALTLTGGARVATGNALANRLEGTSGADTLNGMGGADTMTGGAGHDQYVVDDAGDVVVEGAGGGTDTVLSFLDLVLADNLEALVLGGTAVQGTGNSAANALTGNALDNTLDGAAGIDTLRGLAGNDIYHVDTTLDQVIENVAEGDDTVIASADYTLGAQIETLVLTGAARRGTGNALDNVISGTTGADTLDGGLGADAMNGGAGDDTYLVDNLLDRTVEVFTGGVDTIVSSIDIGLGANIENLVLTGGARQGVGNSQNNRLTGTAFGDTLNGGTGADTMDGGLGDDTYVVDSAGDVIVDAGGVDHVLSQVDFTLGAGIEKLTITGLGATGTGTAGADDLAGAAGGQALVGLEGNDTLDGGTGADTLTGGAGDDTYVIDDAGDVIVEDLLGGNDTAVVMVDGLTVGANVENIRLAGTAHSAIGGSGNNTLSGATGDDTLDGGDGDDLMLGGGGRDHLHSRGGFDTLNGGEGDDVYHVSGGRVEIEDYLGHDTLDCSDSTSDDYVDLSGETESEIENEGCHFQGGGTTSAPLDVQFLQDRSGSFGDDIATVRGLVPQIVAALQAVQSNSTFGVSSFIDKPVSPFGATGEWVFQQELAQSTNVTALSNLYNSMNTLSGADAPESQIEALMQLALHANEVGYRPDAARFVVVFTDAPYHMAGDGAAGGILTPNNGDSLFPGNGAMEDYPTIAQLQAALELANIIPVFAIAGGYEATYQGLTAMLGRGTVVSLTGDSSNIVTAITTGMTAVTHTQIEDANCGSGNDTVIGGDDDNGVNGNSGNDSLDGRGGDDDLTGGLGDDILSGGDGDDTFHIGRGHGYDRFDGGLGADTIVITAKGTVVGVAGLAGVETITAGTFTNVVLRATSAADLVDLSAVTLTGIKAVQGGAGNDTITGSAGADRIEGQDGKDVLSGGAGADKLLGGAGADLLGGGAGADRFIFLTASDSRGGSRADRITDFTTGEDLIDLTAFDGDPAMAGNQMLDFIGNAAFGSVAGQVRAFANAAGWGVVQVDLDGNGSADFELRLHAADGSAYVPVAGDLLL